MMASSMQIDYPWISQPVIANAPMAGFSGAPLAAAITLSGGIGIIGSVNDMNALSNELEAAASIFKDSNLVSASTLPSESSPTLPVGVGLLLFAVKLEEAASVIATHRPAIIWLSCPRAAHDFALFAKTIRMVSPASKIWIQVASVASALEVAQLCNPEVLVLQGVDAGGHGSYPGASIISLVPEARDELYAAGFGHISILAAGGICEGRGLAAALACGAEGVVMGTSFLASNEIKLPAIEYQEAILAARDGGVSTVRGTVFDELAGPSIWPAAYDGRALASKSYEEFIAGAKIEDIREKLAIAKKGVDKGFGGERRAPIWSGSSVGLVREVKSAAEIVNGTRELAKAALKRATEKF